MTELKPCPLCGGIALDIEDREYDQYEVCCGKCRLTVYDPTEWIAVERWNNLPRWIPVEDTLPNPDDDVLVMLSNGSMAVDCTWEYEPGLVIWEGHDDNVVAWQHLPEPYVGVQE